MEESIRVIGDKDGSIMSNIYSNNIANNLDVSAATYLGGAGDDEINAVDISSDGKTVLVAGKSSDDFGVQTGVQTTSLLGGGSGSIVRYDSQTNKVLSVTELPKEVKDMQIASNGDIAIAYSGGIAILNADATQVKWNKTVGGASRISISESGKVAVLQDIRNKSDKIVLFDNQGNELQSWETGSAGRHFQDVVISDGNGGRVIATGYDQKASDLQVAFSQSWSYGGNEQWKNYDYSANRLKSDKLTADTRGERLTIGSDGKLYIAHYVNGGIGASLFSREALDLSKSSDEETVVTDKYNNSFNTGSIGMVYYGQYNLGNGQLIKGQSLLGRGSGDNGNTVLIDSVDATENGTLILAGTAAFGIENRNEQTIEGQKVNGYTSLDGYIAVISPDFQQRLAWTPISKSNNTVAAARNGLVAVGTSTNYSGTQITVNAVQDNKGSQEDGYLLVIGGNETQPASVGAIAPENDITSYGTSNNQEDTPRDTLTNQPLTSSDEIDLSVSSSGNIVSPDEAVDDIDVSNIQQSLGSEESLIENPINNGSFINSFNDSNFDSTEETIASINSFAQDSLTGI